MGFLDRPPLAVPIDPAESGAAKDVSMKVYALVKLLVGVLVLFLVWAIVFSTVFGSVDGMAGGLLAIVGWIVLVRVYAGWILPVRY